MELYEKIILIVLFAAGFGYLFSVALPRIFKNNFDKSRHRLLGDITGEDGPFTLDWKGSGGRNFRMFGPFNFPIRTLFITPDTRFILDLGGGVASPLYQVSISLPIKLIKLPEGERSF